MIDSKPLKPASNAYQAAREAWDAAVSALANVDTLQTTPLEIQRMHNEAQQTLEAVFAAGAELAEGVADAIGRAERIPRE